MSGNWEFDRCMGRCEGKFPIFPSNLRLGIFKLFERSAGDQLFSSVVHFPFSSVSASVRLSKIGSRDVGPFYITRPHPLLCQLDPPIMRCRRRNDRGHFTGGLYACGSCELVPSVVPLLDPQVHRPRPARPRGACNPPDCGGTWSARPMKTDEILGGY